MKSCRWPLVKRCAGNLLRSERIAAGRGMVCAV
jgi:hypothetical protein